MHKFVQLGVICALITQLHASEVQLNLPKGSILPNFREFSIPAYENNPFEAKAQTLESGIELVTDSFIESRISHEIQGYLHSEEPSSSALLMQNGNILACGESVQINFNLEELGAPIKTTLDSIQLPYAIFSVEDRKFSIDLLAANSTYRINTEIQLTHGLILHEDGWIIAPIGNLKIGDALATFINGIKYPVHLVSLYKQEDIALLKIFKRNTNKLLPYIQVSKEALETGDVILTQENLAEHPPYKKQVVTGNNTDKPDVSQFSGAVKLNLEHEVVSMYTTTSIPSSRLLDILGDVPQNKNKPSKEITSAIVNIIKE